MVNNGVSADETAVPTGPTDNATVATGHSDTLLPPASSTPATPGTNTTDVPTAEAEVPKVDTPKNEGVATETPNVSDGTTGTGVATPTTPSVSTPSQDEGKTSENSEATPTTSENASTLLKRLQLPLKEVKETLLLIQLQLHQKLLPLQSTQ